MKMTIAGCAFLLSTAAAAQTPPAGGRDALDVTAEEIRRMVDLAVNNPLKSLDAGRHTVFVWFESRQPTAKGATPGDPGTQVHTQLTEIYLIVEGTATLRTGGTIVDPRPLEIPGTLPGTTVPRFPTPSFVGKAEGGTSRKVKAGDIIVLPPNTVHAWDEVESRLSYINLRIDPEHKLGADYTHPALRR
jgi:mannose-6-phosphate isomerase-like protein (cupin superfamily)